MADDFTYDGTKIVVANRTEGNPGLFAYMYIADKQGTLSIHDKGTIEAIDGSAQAVDRTIQPADYIVLGGTTGEDLYFTTTNWTDMSTTTVQIVGTTADDGVQTEDLIITGNGNVYTTKFFKTVISTEVTVFTSGGASPAYDCELIQGQWGVMWSGIPGEVSDSWRIDCDIDIGNDSDATYFQSLNEMIYMADGKVIRLEEGTFAMGLAGDDWSKDGSVLSMRVDTNYSMVSGGDTTSVFKTYGSMIMRRLSDDDYDVSFYSGTWIARNLIISGEGGAGGASNNSKITLVSGTIDWKDVRILHMQGFYSYITPVNFDNVHIHNVVLGYVAYASHTVTGLKITSSASKELFISGAGVVLTLIDPLFHPSAANLTITNADGSLIEQYSCNIHAIDSEGLDHEGVTIVCKDKDGNEVFSGITDENGDLLGPELVSNSNLTDWTADNPDDWTVVFESGNDPEISEAATGETHADTPTLGGGMCNIYRSNAGDIYMLHALTTVVGRKYRFSIKIDTVTAGGIDVYSPNGQWSTKNYTTIGVKTFTFIATVTSETMSIWNKDSNAVDLTFDNISVREIGQVIPYKTWTGTSETLVTHSPHKFTILKPGHRTTTLLDITVDRPIVWEQLQTTGIPGFGFMGAAARERYIYPESD